MTRTPVEPILAVDLFPEMRAELLAILHALTDEQWTLPTACEGWSVRDVALHLLADDVQLLSGMRDHDGIYFRTDDWQHLVALIDQQNDVWVKATRRMSRRLLMSLLEFTGAQCDDFLLSLNPFAMAGSVGWTGNTPDPRWLHIARAITEYWMHHQHICDAIGVTSLKNAHYVHPVLSAFVHALPQTYRDVDAPTDTLITFVVTREGGDIWHLVREREGWKLYSNTDLTPTSIVTMNVDTAWRMFTKGIETDELRQRVTVTGDVALGEALLGTVAIIA